MSRAGEEFGALLGARVLQHAMTLEGLVQRQPLDHDVVVLEPLFVRFDPRQTYTLGESRGVPSVDDPLFVFRRLLLPTTAVGGLVDVLVSQSGCNGPVLFELVLTLEGGTVIVGGTRADLSFLAGTWERAGCALAPADDPVPSLAGRAACLVEFLSPAGYQCAVNAPDGVWESLYGLAKGLPAGEAIIVQVAYAPCRSPWHENIQSLIGAHRAANGRGSLLKPKCLDEPLFAVDVRLWSTTASVLPGLLSVLGCFRSEGRPFLHRSLGDYSFLHGEDRDLLFSRRRCYAPGQLFTATELGLFVTLPGNDVGLRFEYRRGLRVPDRFRSPGGLLLGVNHADGHPVRVYHHVGRQYNTHLSIAGTSGMRKSTALQTWVHDLALQGHGVCVIDPHGPLVESMVGLLGDIDPERFVYLNFDDASVVAFNGFAGVPVEEQGRYALDFVQTASTLVSTGGYHRLSYFLLNAAAGLYALQENLSTLPDLFRHDRKGDELRRKIIESCPNTAARSFWEYEFPSHREDDHLPLLNRFSALWMDDRTARIFSQRENRVDLPGWMDEGKIVLVKTPANIEAAKISGGLFIGQYKHAAFRRAGTPSASRLFFLILDEMPRFAPSASSLAEILDAATKGGLRLWTVHQQSNQLPEELVKTMAGIDTLVFGVNWHDAKHYSQVLRGVVSPETLAGLRPGEVYARLGGDVVDFTLNPPRSPDPLVAERLIARSRERYYVPPAEVSLPVRRRGGRVIGRF